MAHRKLASLWTTLFFGRDFAEAIHAHPGGKLEPHRLTVAAGNARRLATKRPRPRDRPTPGSKAEGCHRRCTCLNNWIGRTRNQVDSDPKQPRPGFHCAGDHARLRIASLAFRR
jgi:hypothetical protein